MHPILVKFEFNPITIFGIKIDHITISTYGFLLAVGVLSSILLILYLAKKQDINREALSNFLFLTILMGLLGAKIFLLMTDFDSYTNSFKDFSGLIFSGGTFYGGLVFGALFAVWYIKKHKMNFMILGDMVGPGVALAHFFGRLGCFSAGCCWGREAHDSAIAVTFTDTRATTGVLLDTPLYPTQLMEAILNLLNFIILIFLYHRKKFHGQIFAIYIFNYSIIRFCLEFFRGDGDRGYVIGSMEQPFSSLSVPQLISLIGIITAIILYRIFKKKSQTDEQKLKK